MPRISVIIPTFNNPTLLTEAVESVLKQSFHDWETIIVDDGSTDNTAEVVQSWQRVVKYIFQTNRGVGAARNTGAAAATSDLLLFLDHDDVLLPHCLETCVPYMDDHPDVGLAVTGYEVIDSSGRVMRVVRPWEQNIPLNLEAWAFGSQALPTQWILRREWWSRVKGIDETILTGDDWDFGFRLAFAQCAMDLIPSVVYRRRLHSANQSKDTSCIRASALMASNKIWSTPGLAEKYPNLQRKSYAYIFLCAAAREYAGGDTKLASADLQKALKLDPALKDGDPPRGLAELEGMCETLDLSEYDNYIRRVFNSLSPGALGWSVHRRSSTARVAMRMVFLADTWADWRIARAALWLAVINQPACLVNRGVWSILLKSLTRGQSGNILRLVRRRIVGKDR